MTPLNIPRLRDVLAKAEAETAANIEKIRGGYDNDELENADYDAFNIEIRNQLPALLDRLEAAEATLNMIAHVGAYQKPGDTHWHCDEESTRQRARDHLRLVRAQDEGGGDCGKEAK